MHKNLMWLTVCVCVWGGGGGGGGGVREGEDFIIYFLDPVLG